MTGLRAGNWRDAYALCSPTLQDTLGSPAGLGNRIIGNNVQPVSWTFESINIGDSIRIDGKAVLPRNQSVSLNLDLVRAGGTFQINGFLLK